MSDLRETVDVWLKETASLAGIDSLTLNSQGVCALKYGDKVEIVFEAPEATEVLHFYCPICDIPEETELELLRRLLEWNMFGLETRGASFAIDRESNRAVLCYSLPIAGTDITAFQNTLGNFAEVCERFCEELAGNPNSNAAGDVTQFPESFLRA